jgi:cytochrome c553
MWTQHLVVLVAVAACAAIIGRQAFVALQGRKSRLGGCGTCHGCATDTPTKSRTQMISLDQLKRRR